MSDTVHALEAALAAQQQYRIAVGGRDYSMIEALEGAIERAKQPRPLGPVFGSAKKSNPPTPAAPIQPAAPPPLPINVKVTSGVYYGPRSTPPANATLTGKHAPHARRTVPSNF